MTKLLFMWSEIKMKTIKFDRSARISITLCVNWELGSKEWFYIAEADYNKIVAIGNTKEEAIKNMNAAQLQPKFEIWFH